MSEIDLVTGGSGFIGGHLVDALLARGRRVRVLDLTPPRQPDAAWIQGSILDAARVAEAVQGVARLFHVAGDPSLWARRRGDLDRLNRSGAEIVLDAGVRAGVERIVLTSTHAVDVRTGGAPARLSDMPGPYTRAKFQAESLARHRAAEGAPVIIVAPTMPMGPGDRNLTPPTRMLLEFLRGENPAFLEFTSNLVDVREVAEGHVLAAEKGAPGARYILGRHNLPMSRFLGLVESMSGRRTPRRRISYPLAWGAAAAMQALSGLTGRAPRASLEGVRLARRLQPVADNPAEALGLPAWPLEPMLGEAIAWLAEERLWRRPG